MAKKKQVEYTINDVMEKVGNVMDVMERGFGGLENKIETLREETAEFFTSFKQDFDRLDEKVDKIDGRLMNVEVRLASVEDRLINVEVRLVNVEDRLVGVESRLEDVEVACVHNTTAVQALDEKFTGRFDDLESRVYQDLNAISKTLVKHDRIFARLAIA